MDTSNEARKRISSGGRWLRGMLLAAAALLVAPAVVHVQGLDICGCASFPGLQPFDSANSATWPPGTTLSSSSITIPLPPDGILRFSSFSLVNRYLFFGRNAANTPATILVAGDVTFSGSSCCYYVTVEGTRGSNGTAALAGVGGLGGPGGFRGGDGAFQAVNGAAVGGAGFGPGGGLGGAPGSCGGTGGQFLGVPELLPLLGGSGGGGGCSTSASTGSCSGGGGSGGGGALLIAANGTMSISNYQIFADGAFAGSAGNTTCASAGGSGSGGAIRFVANRFAQPGTANLFARAGEGNTSAGGTDGRIRLESVDASSQTVFTATPGALRVVGPTPLANPLSPAVTVTSVGGSAAPAVPQGTYGGIDIVLNVPGVTTIDLATSGVPSGTTLEVKVKPRLGATPVSQIVPLTNCDTAGDCQATATFNLAAGAYVVEGRATFQTP